MAMAGVYSGCVMPVQTLEPRSSFLLRQNSRSASVPVLPGPVILVRACVFSQRLDLRQGSSLADFKVIQADALKQDELSKWKPRLEYYGKLTARLAGEGHLLEVADLVVSLVDAGIDRQSFITAIEMKDVHSACRAVLDGGDVDLFVAFARKLRLAGVTPFDFVDDGAVSLLSGRCRRMLMQGAVDKCVQLLTTLSECGFAVRRLIDIRQVITACAKHRNVDAALRYARLLPPVNLHYNCIMQQFSHRGTLESVFAVFASMTESGIKPDMYSYRSLLDACAHHGDVAKASSVFKDIVSSGSVPNVFVYNSFMNVCAENTGLVWELYKDMQRLGVKPDLATYNIMLKSCSLSKSFNKAISLYEDMKSSAVSGGLKLDVFTYTTTIDIFGDAKLVHLALTVKEDMLSAGVAPNVLTWTALVGASGNVGMVEQAFSLFNEMLLAGCAPNEHTYNVLINACCKGRQHERAMQLFRVWKKHGRICAQREWDHPELYSESMVALSKICEPLPDNRSRLFRDVVKKFPGRVSGSRPNLVTYNTLMKSCVEEPNLVKEIMGDILAAGLKPDLTSWSTYIDACGSTGSLQEAIKLFKNMREEGIVADLVVYTSMIKACVKAGDSDMAFMYFKELKEVGLRPNKVTYYTLFKAQSTCRKLCDVRRALALYEEMRKAGYAPNDRILRVLLEQWVEGAIAAGGDMEKPSQFSLDFRNEVSTDFSNYSMLQLQKVALDAWDPKAEPHLMIDLHGLSRGEARFAVLALLSVIKERHNQGYQVKDDLVIITGVGRRSEVPGFPIIRQAILHVLENELSLPVKCGPKEVHITGKTPLRILGEDNILASGLCNQPLMADTNSVSTDSQCTSSSSMVTFGASNTGADIGEGKQSTDAFGARKPTNFGRLIVSKDALQDWLSKKHGIVPTRRLRRPIGEADALNEQISFKS